MKNTTRTLVIAIIAIVFTGSISSCQKEILGCTNPQAWNYNQNATMDNGGCIGRVYGCTDYNSVNYNPQANTDNGTCQYTGRAVFWFSGPRDNATVHISGMVGYITQYYPVIYPDCGSAGCANFILTAGTYTYHAENAYNTWDGSMTVNTNECSLILLD